jgi:catechol 2,3-dioxygenase-like lactoylglutathione lyase family enzyme
VGRARSSHGEDSWTDPADIDLAVAEVEKAGGKILKRGELSPGFPYVYVADPDGHTIEIWYE